MSPVVEKEVVEPVVKLLSVVLPVAVVGDDISVVVEEEHEPVVN